LGLDLEVTDITISGSNAAYTYTDHSDIDLHLVADLPRADANEVYRELFDAKKYQYNDHPVNPLTQRSLTASVLK
jgi:ABC-type proline/glycine betaine transport system substrate-binding protein